MELVAALAAWGLLSDDGAGYPVSKVATTSYRRHRMQVEPWFPIGEVYNDAMGSKG